VTVMRRAHHPGGVALAAFLAGPAATRLASQQRLPAVCLRAGKADHRGCPPGSAWVCRRHSHRATATSGANR